MFDVDDDWGDAEDDATSLFTTQKSTELAPMVTAPCHDCNDSESESDVASETTDDIEASLHDLDLKEESTQEVLPEDIPLLSRIQSRCVDVVNNNDIPEENHTVFEFKPFYVACVTEDHFDSALDDHVQKLLLEYKNSDKALEKEEATQISSAVTKVFDQENHEKYEKGVAKHGDVVFQSFVDRVALCPSQILRYSWGGLPLLMSPLGEDSASSLICPNCGHGKVFELQIMPTLVHLLRCEGDADGERSRQSLDFGTVLVYSCRASCWNAENPKLVEETIVVQSEPGSEF